MYRNPDRSRLIRNGAGDRLTDPPGRVGAEFIAFPVIKLLDCLNESKISLLDQVEQLHAPSGIPFCDTHHKTQVRLRKLLLCLLVTEFDLLCQFDLLIRGKQRHFSDLF